MKREIINNKAMMFPHVPHDPFTNLQMEEIKKLIRTKNIDQIPVLWAFFVGELKPPEICEIVNMTQTNVRQVIHRFRQELKDVYKL